MSDSDIVPESYQNRLMLWRDTFTKGYFEIGRIANELTILHSGIESARIYSAIGRFCGKSGRTVRDYAEISAFYSEKIIDEYEILPFSHFRFAKSCGDRWLEVLNFSASHPGASEEAVADWYTGEYLTPKINLSSYASSTEVDKHGEANGVATESKIDVNINYPYMDINPDIWALNELLNRSRGLLRAGLSPIVHNELSDCIERLQRLIPLIAGQVGIDSMLRFEYNSVSP